MGKMVKQDGQPEKSFGNPQNMLKTLGLGAKNRHVRET